MQELVDLGLNPTIPYHRELRGADFSLEANTDRAPGQGRFFLMRRGRVLMDTRDFNEALDAYHGLCREFWHEHLHAGPSRERISSAWGLLSLDPTDREAAEVIRSEGSPGDVHRMDSIRRRHWAMRRMAGRRKAKTAA